MAAVELESLRRLQEMGEITPSDLYEAEQRSSSVVKGRQEEETNHQQRHLELISMLGLHPAVGEIEIGGELPSTPPDPVPMPCEEELLQHPRICAALVAHKVSEEELRMEIRKQYPNLELSRDTRGRMATKSLPSRLVLPCPSGTGTVKQLRARPAGVN